MKFGGYKFGHCQHDLQFDVVTTFYATLHKYRYILSIDHKKVRLERTVPGIEGPLIARKIRN